MLADLLAAPARLIGALPTSRGKRLGDDAQLGLRPTGAVSTASQDGSARLCKQRGHAERVDPQRVGSSSRDGQLRHVGRENQG